MKKEEKDEKRPRRKSQKVGCEGWKRFPASEGDPPKERRRCERSCGSHGQQEQLVTCDVIS